MGLTNLYGLLVEVLFVDRCGVFQDRLGNYPRPILVKTEKTTVSARMTGQTRRVAGLGDFHQQHIVVTIQSQLMHGLDVAGLFTFEPQFVARAAEIHRPPQLRRFLQGFAVHPGEHQHIVAADFLRDYGNQPLGVPFDLVNPMFSFLHEVIVGN